jgi:regulatory protein
METSQSSHSDCYNAAMRMLVRREHSQLELTQKLHQKDFDDEEIVKAVEQLVEQNYQSDARFSEAFVTMRFNQGKGPVMIVAELKQRGIEYFDLSVFDWFESAKNIRVAKYGDELPSNYNDIAKQKRFLQSRGFGFDHINQSFSI